MSSMLDLTHNRYSSQFRTNGRGEYRGVEYELQHMGLQWRIRSGIGQFFGETSGDAIQAAKVVPE